VPRTGAPRYHPRVLTLPPDAARALATARAEGHDLRYDCREHCHTGRFRLSVRYRVADPAGGSPRDVNLGLLWSEDEAALRTLGESLARGAHE